MVQEEILQFQLPVNHFQTGLLSPQHHRLQLLEYPLFQIYGAGRNPPITPRSSLSNLSREKMFQIYGTIIVIQDHIL